MSKPEETVEIVEKGGSEKKSEAEMCQESCEKILKIFDEHDFFRPEIGLVLGSGMGKLANSFEKRIEIPYEEIPHFKGSTMNPEKNLLVAGVLSNRNVVCMMYRYHSYEGYSLKECAYPVRVMRRLGCLHLLMTCAAGGINRSFKPGNLMLITDYLNHGGGSPLEGKNENCLGPRFPDVLTTYPKCLNEEVLKVAKKLGIPMQQGVYVMCKGPQYESKAEIKQLRTLGADAVGMSTVPESIVAAHMGMTVTAIALISNMAAGVLDGVELDHSEVVEESEKQHEVLEELLCGILPIMKIDRENFIRATKKTTCCIGEISGDVHEKCEVYYSSDLENPETFNCIGRHKEFDDMQIGDFQEANAQYFQKQGKNVREMDRYPPGMHFEYMDKGVRRRNKYLHLDEVVKFSRSKFENDFENDVRGSNFGTTKKRLHVLRFNIPSNIHCGCIINDKVLAHEDDPIRRYLENGQCDFVPCIVIHRDPKNLDFKGMSFKVGFDKYQKDVDGNYPPEVTLISPCLGIDTFSERMMVNTTYDSRTLFIRKGDGGVDYHGTYTDNLLDSKDLTAERVKEIYRNNDTEISHSKMVASKSVFLPEDENDDEIWKFYNTVIESSGSAGNWEKTRYYSKTLLAVPSKKQYPTFVYTFSENTLEEIFKLVMEDLEKKRKKRQIPEDVKYALFQNMQGCSFGWGELIKKSKTKYQVFFDNFMCDHSMRPPMGKFAVAFCKKEEKKKAKAKNTCSWKKVATGVAGMVLAGAAAFGGTVAWKMMEKHIKKKCCEVLVGEDGSAGIGVSVSSDNLSDE